MEIFGKIMKVLIVSTHYAEYTVNLANSLADKADVALVLSKANMDAELAGDYHVSKRIKNVLFLGGTGFRCGEVLPSSIALVKLYRLFKPDVVHIQETSSNIIPLVLWLARTKRKVLTIHDYKPHIGQDSRQNLRRKMILFLLRKYSKHYIVHGKTIKEDMLDVYGENEIDVIQHGTVGEDSDVVSWVQGELLFFGRIEKYKGLGVLLDSLKILDKNSVDYHLTIAGKGSDAHNHINTIRNNKKITFLNEYISCDHIQKLMEQANIVVLPYIEATQSGVAAMAINYNRPIVSSDVGCIRDMIVEGKNGELVDKEDPESLAYSIMKILQNPGLTKSYIEGAIEIKNERLNWKVLAEETNRVYETLLADLA